MLNITRVSFGVTKNLGNYESFRVDMEAVVLVGESCQEVLDDLRTQVSIEADFHQSDYVDLLQKSRQVKLELASLVSERDRIYEQLKKLESIWTLIGIEIQSKFPSEISALLSSYFDICSSFAGDSDDSAEVEVDPIPFDSLDDDNSREF